MSASEAGDTLVASEAAGKWPTQVRIAFWVFLAVIAFRVVLIPLTIVREWIQAEAILRVGGAKYSAQAVLTAQEMVHGAAIFADVLVVALYGLCVLAAFALRRGSGWARIVLTVLGALSILTAVLALGTPTGAALGLAGAAGIILLWLKPSNAWFRAGKAARLAEAHRRADARTAESSRPGEPAGWPSDRSGG